MRRYCAEKPDKADWWSSLILHRPERGGGSLFPVKLIISEGNMLLSYFNHCPATRTRERPSFMTGNCCGRMRSSTLRARKHRREKWSRLLLLVLLLRVPFIAYQFSLLFPYHSSHHRPPLVPAHADAFGQFLFHRADESDSRRSNSETAHLTSINNNVTLRLESLCLTHSLPLFICPLCA